MNIKPTPMTKDYFAKAEKEDFIKCLIEIIGEFNEYINKENAEIDKMCRILSSKGSVVISPHHLKGDFNEFQKFLANKITGKHEKQ